jgi:hypothetical protein
MTSPDNLSGGDQRQINLRAAKTHTGQLRRLGKRHAAITANPDLAFANIADPAKGKSREVNMA